MFKDVAVLVLSTALLVSASLIHLVEPSVVGQDVGTVEANMNSTTMSTRFNSLELF